jgi:hypothetical protein
MLKRLIGGVVGLAMMLGVLLLIGYCTADRKDYPGKAEFEKANATITTKNQGVGHGNTPEATKAAARFAQSIKPLQAMLFKGGSGRSWASGGEFLTYCRHNPDSVAFIVHVPELRHYKGAESRDALAFLAWTAANKAAEGLTFSTEKPAIIVGLRGFASYGPIWSGKRGGEPEVKTDNLDEKRRLYPYFVSPAEPK